VWLDTAHASRNAEGNVVIIDEGLIAMPNSDVDVADEWPDVLDISNQMTRQFPLSTAPMDCDFKLLNDG